MPGTSIKVRSSEGGAFDCGFRGSKKSGGTYRGKAKLAGKRRAPKLVRSPPKGLSQ